MGVIVVFFVLMAVLVLFAFLQFPPAYADAKLVSTFNRITLLVCVFLCFAWFLNARATWKDTEADRFWPYLALLGSLAIEIGFLGLFFLLRNFWIFKPPRRPGSGGFGL